MCFYVKLQRIVFCYIKNGRKHYTSTSHILLIIYAVSEKCSTLFRYTNPLSSPNCAVKEELSSRDLASLIAFSVLAKIGMLYSLTNSFMKLLPLGETPSSFLIRFKTVPPCSCGCSLLVSN